MVCHGYVSRAEAGKAYPLHTADTAVAHAGKHALSSSALADPTFFFGAAIVNHAIFHLLCWVAWGWALTLGVPMLAGNVELAAQTVPAAEGTPKPAEVPASQAPGAPAGAADTKPAESPAEAAKPAEAQPAVAASPESKPAETKPAAEPSSTSRPKPSPRSRPQRANRQRRNQLPKRRALNPLKPRPR